jgi:uncharacterized FlaG/YvyC family protein
MSILFAKPDTNHYNIAMHNGFHQRCLVIFNRHQSVIDAPILIESYSQKREQEDRIYKWMRELEFTEQKAETDHSRDDTYININANVRLNLRHFDPDISNAANRINKLLANYGDVVHASYDAETIAIDSIVTYLRSDKYKEDVTLLRLDAWINRLDELNTQFKQYVEATAQEEINKPEISAKESRRQTDEALRKITSRMNALATLNGPDAYMPLAREFNELVNHYNQLVHEHYGRIHTRINIDSVYIAPIPPQTFTGKPIFVIPELKFTKVTNEGTTQIVELIFTEDFTVSYKNNINKGTATIRIQGIGKYKGEIVAIFNIE